MQHNTMENVCHTFYLQLMKAKETLGILEHDLHDVHQRLKNNPANAEGLQELKHITLNMTITLNEVDDCQTALDVCRRESLKLESRYND